MAADAALLPGHIQHIGSPVRAARLSLLTRIRRHVFIFFHPVSSSVAAVGPPAPPPAPPDESHRRSGRYRSSGPSSRVIDHFHPFSSRTASRTKMLADWPMAFFVPTTGIFNGADISVYQCSARVYKGHRVEVGEMYKYIGQKKQTGSSRLFVSSVVKTFFRSSLFRFVVVAVVVAVAVVDVRLSAVPVFPRLQESLISLVCVVDAIKGKWSKCSRAARLRSRYPTGGGGGGAPLSFSPSADRPCAGGMAPNRTGLGVFFLNTFLSMSLSLPLLSTSSSKMSAVVFLQWSPVNDRRRRRRRGTGFSRFSLFFFGRFSVLAGGAPIVCAHRESVAADINAIGVVPVTCKRRRRKRRRAGAGGGGGGGGGYWSVTFHPACVCPSSVDVRFHCREQWLQRQFAFPNQP